MAEGIVTSLWIAGASLLAALAFLSFRRSTRPYALPTLCASMLTGGWLVRNAETVPVIAIWFLVFSLFAGLVFGAHAIFIRWLLRRT